MKSILAGGMVAFAALTCTAQAASGPNPSGVWMRGDGNARVRIAPCGKDICATNLWIGDTSGGEAVGDVLVMTVKPQSDSTLVGTAYDRKRNLSYSMELNVQNASMTAKGCVLAGMVCKNVSWTRGR